ncbi:GyrI-like domain-containing protein [Candidatus Poribacteria bacterium]
MEPRIVDRDAFTVVGILAHGDPSDMDYEELWDQFTPYHDRIKQLSTDKAYYNVYFGPEEEGMVDIVVGMVVEDTENIPEGLVVREVPDMHCAIFECTLETIGQTYSYIYEEWLPKSQYEHGGKPDFEYFPPDSGPGNSMVLIHIPIEEG